MKTFASTIHQSYQQEHLLPAEDTVLLNPEHPVGNLLELINKRIHHFPETWFLGLLANL